MTGLDEIDLLYLTLTLAAEARGEPREFQCAVGEVIMQRWRLAQQGRAWRRAKSVKDIVTWPKQFSCWNDDDPNRKWIDRAIALDLGPLDSRAYRQCRWIAEGFVRGVWIPVLAGADHYHTLPLGKFPRWADEGRLIGRIEARLATGWFYKLIV